MSYTSVCTTTPGCRLQPLLLQHLGAAPLGSSGGTAHLTAAPVASQGCRSARRDRCYASPGKGVAAVLDEVSDASSCSWLDGELMILMMISSG